MLSGGDEEGAFTLSSAGQLSVTKTLDREFGAEYTLLITATDSGMSGESELSTNERQEEKNFLTTQTKAVCSVCALLSLWYIVFSVLQKRRQCGFFLLGGFCPAASCVYLDLVVELVIADKRLTCYCVEAS